MSIKDVSPVRFGSFAGINNRQPIDRLRLRADEARPVRDAVNVDLSASGTFQTRAGHKLTLAAEQCRSLFPVDDTGALVAVGDKLMRFDGTAVTELATLTTRHASVGYTKTPLGIVWSDGFRMGLVRGWVDAGLLPPAPNPAPAITASSGGALPAGTYGVAFASALSDGRRSEMTVPEYIDVPDSGRILVGSAALSVPADIFVTAANGEVFYRAGRTTGGSASVGVLNQDGEAAAYEVEVALPPSRILGFHDGRLLAAQGSVLLFSRPYSLGLYRPETDFIALPDEIRLLASAGPNTLIIGTETAHWLVSGDMADPTMRQIAPYGAVAGTLAEVPNATNSLDLMWFTQRGQVRASGDGSLALLQDQQIQFPSAPSGASVFRETNGMRQFIASLNQARPAASAAARCFMDARVIE